MNSFIESWASKYDEEKYSTRFYFDLINKVHTSTNPEDLGSSIIHLLHWKDGKVYKSNMGQVIVNGFSYSLGQPKPNTYNPKKHSRILTSKDFYNWARKVIEDNRFSCSHLEALRGSPFALWSKSSIVIPAFVMHILSPKIYPLYDQHVERAKRALLAQTLNANSTELNIDTYKCYQEYFLDLTKEYATRNSIEAYKKIDEALWSFGKWLKGTSLINGGNRNKLIAKNENNTSAPDDAFKKQVLQLIDDGLTQLEAIKKTAVDRGVTLKDSYYIHPGSHIHRWRKQV